LTSAISLLKYNQVRQLSSHNSYDGAGPKGDLRAQFENGTRSFELDLHVAAPHHWDVYHVFPPGDYIANLTDGLHQLRRLHDDVPTHEVVTVWLELKDGGRSRSHEPADLDRTVKTLVGDLVFGPAHLSAGHAGESLRGVIASRGWPLLESLKGRLLFVLMGDDEAAAEYSLSLRLNALCFAAPEHDIVGKVLRPGQEWSNAVFFNCHNTDGSDSPLLVHQLGLVSRLWRVDSQREYAFALSCRAHHVATDHVTSDLFLPRLVDKNGRPFAPF
jgi:hypothetical protein